MTPIQSLYALFQGPAHDAGVSNVDLVINYSKTWTTLAAYAAIVDAIAPTTQDLANRQAASDLLVTTCMACCFAALCEGMAGKSKSGDYKTAQDVEADMTSLADKWAGLADRSLDAFVRQQLSELYAGVVSILQRLEITLPAIGVMDAPVVPASVLSYWLYDSDDYETVLADLNPDLPPLLYDGDVNVLTKD
jgi:hypothetical protein